HGAHPATGGGPTPGIAKNGILKWPARSTGFITTCTWTAGMRREFTIEGQGKGAQEAQGRTQEAQELHKFLFLVLLVFCLVLLVLLPLVHIRGTPLTAPYIELHAGSAFSFLDGAALPEEFIGAAAEYGMPAMALLDRDGVYGAPRFHLAGRKAGVQAHIGAEITLTTGICYPVLAETREGYQNLCRLLPRMNLRA